MVLKPFNVKKSLESFEQFVNGGGLVINSIYRNNNQYLVRITLKLKELKGSFKENIKKINYLMSAAEYSMYYSTLQLIPITNKIIEQKYMFNIKVRDMFVQILEKKLQTKVINSSFATENVGQLSVQLYLSEPYGENNKEDSLIKEAIREFYTELVFLVESAVKNEVPLITYRVSIESESEELFSMKTQYLANNIDLVVRSNSSNINATEISDSLKENLNSANELYSEATTKSELGQILMGYGDSNIIDQCKITIFSLRDSELFYSKKGEFKIKKSYGKVTAGIVGTGYLPLDRIISLSKEANALHMPAIWTGFLAENIEKA